MSTEEVGAPQPGGPQPAAATGAVFLSYASQDAEAAQRLCQALRAAGIEVWFDQSALRGGDAWDQSIRKQIKTCALFLPLISKHTHERAEGYFRLEWKLAVDRSHLITAHKAFLMPVVIDDTGEDEEHVPERFREVQWTRLPAGETPPAFVTRIQQLLSGEASATPTLVRRPAAVAFGRSSRSKFAWLALAVVLALTTAYVVIKNTWVTRPATSAAFSPPPHSIAVLPFVNMSGDKEQEYFSDGLSEELLNSLSRINDLQVAARTSSFYFKGEHSDLATIAHKLNVASVLEGSVRRAGNTVRVTAQLNSAVTGYHLWSQTYDRDLGDVLKLQTEIAEAVASALKVTLLKDVAGTIELGGTHNPAAFDAYLRASRSSREIHNEKDVLAEIAEFTEAIQLDPQFALAYAGRSLAFTDYAEEYATGNAIRDGFDKALADAREAVALAAGLADGHLALARLFETGFQDFSQANDEYGRAAELAPGNAQLLRTYGLFAVRIGRIDAGIAAARRAVTLDPLSSRSHSNLGLALYAAHSYHEAIAATQPALTLDPNRTQNHAHIGLFYYELGNIEGARASCEIGPDNWQSQQCLALVYARLGRRADAETALAKIQTSMGDAPAYQYAEIYAQWGNVAKALEWLDTAVRLRDPGLLELKSDPLVNPLRSEPRFQAVERELKFPGR
jgi:TolB-like protein/Tfp pilus assembly protein PilF